MPGGRWLTILMNRIDPDLFGRAFTDRVQATWPKRPAFVAIDGKTSHGKTSRRSHDCAAGQPPLHLVLALATTARLMLDQEAVPDKASETTAIPVLIERLSVNGGWKGALVSIDAIATNPSIAAAITAADADYLLAVKANLPTLRAEIESLFETALADEVETITEHDKEHGRVEKRRVSVVRQVDWLEGPRRFPGETRLPCAACLVRVCALTELKDRCRSETRHYVSYAALTAQRAADAVRGHWTIENSLHWVLEIVFADDQSRLRKGHGARNMAIVRHFALNLVRAISDKRSIKLRRKRAGWDPTYLAAILGELSR